jgi:acylphosphatase
VGFRWFARTLAQRYGLVGWIRNRGRGDVEILVEGEKEAIQEFVQDLKVGPRFGRVDAVDVKWIQVTGQFNQFYIKH